MLQYLVATYSIDIIAEDFNSDLFERYFHRPCSDGKQINQHIYLDL